MYFIHRFNISHLNFKTINEFMFQLELPQYGMVFLGQRLYDTTLSNVDTDHYTFEHSGLQKNAD